MTIPLRERGREGWGGEDPLYIIERGAWRGRKRETRKTREIYSD
jgi:hypothetical protein